MTMNALHPSGSSFAQVDVVRDNLEQMTPSTIILICLSPHQTFAPGVFAQLQAAAIPHSLADLAAAGHGAGA